MHQSHDQFHLSFRLLFRYGKIFEISGLQIFNLQALEGKDIKELLTNVGSAGPAAPAGAAAGGAAAPADAPEEKKEEGKFLEYYNQVWRIER